MNKKLLVSMMLVASLVLGIVGMVSAAPQDPDATPGTGQGVLFIQTQDNEITVAKDGEGYNIHRFSTLRLVVNAGQNDFDYFCGSTKYFIGNVQVVAGETTTVMLKPGLCAEPVVSHVGSKSYNSFALQTAYTIGFLDGLYYGCQGQTPNTNYSPNAAEQSAYNEGFWEANNGKCLGTPWQVSEAYNEGLNNGGNAACGSAVPQWTNDAYLQSAYYSGFQDGLKNHCP
jgi:hypothetical protein